mgnify:CR=1 FL=1
MANVKGKEVLYDLLVKSQTPKTCAYQLATWDLEPPVQTDD